MANDSKKMKSANIGELRFKEKEDGSRVPRIVLDDGIILLKGRWDSEQSKFVDHQQLDVGKFKTLQCVKPEAGLDALLASGKISKTEYDKRMERLEQNNVGYKVVFFPPQE